MNISEILKNESIDSLVERINNYVSDPTRRISKEVLAKLLNKKRQRSFYKLALRDGRIIVAILGRHPETYPLSFLPFCHLLGAEISPKVIAVYGSPREFAVAALAQYFSLQNKPGRIDHNNRDTSRRAQRQKDIKENNPRRLDFLWEALRSRGIYSNGQIAKLTLCSNQCIDYYRVIDDMKLSVIERVLETAKLKPQFSFINNKSVNRKTRTSYRPAHRQVRAHYQRRTIPKTNNIRLACLSSELTDSGLTLQGFCERYGLNYHLLYYALQRDDMSLSNLEMIAEAIGCVLVIDIYDL